MSPPHQLSVIFFGQVNESFPEPPTFLPQTTSYWLEFWQMAVLNWKGGWEMEHEPTRKKL